MKTAMSIALAIIVAACSSDAAVAPADGARAARAPGMARAPSSASAVYTLRLFNVDDTVTVYINGLMAARAGYFEDTGEIPIDTLIVPGQNTFHIAVDNYLGGWTFGFELRKNGAILHDESCGTVGVWGCKNNDLTLGRVFERRRVFRS